MLVTVYMPVYAYAPPASELYMWPYRIYAAEIQSLVVLHDLFLLAALDSLAGAVLHAYSVFVRPDKFRDKLPSALERNLHLASDCLPVLPEHLERLVKPCRGHCEGIVLHVPVESGEECVVDFFAVFKCHAGVLGLDCDGDVVVFSQVYFNKKALACNDFAVDGIYYIVNVHNKVSQHIKRGPFRSPYIAFTLQR